MAVRKDKNRRAKSRELDDHVVAETTAVEKGGLDGDKDLQWKATQGEVHSDTKLEDDDGSGSAVVLRNFYFAANPEAFHARTPSKQELFNAHAKQIEYFLYKDGFDVVYGASPQLRISKDRKNYCIAVWAAPRKGFLVNDRPLTLSQVNEPRKD